MFVSVYKTIMDAYLCITFFFLEDFSVIVIHLLTHIHSGFGGSEQEVYQGIVNMLKKSRECQSAPWQPMWSHNWDYGHCYKWPSQRVCKAKGRNRHLA